MACFVPFNNRNLDVTLFMFKPTVVVVDEVVESLKQFCLRTETLGCVQSSIFRSIHGNLIVWYGGWMKKSTENKQLLTSTLLSMLRSMSMSSMAVLVEHSFFDAYGGESRDGSSAAKFSSGDIVSMNIIASCNPDDLHDVSYANLALFKSRFLKMEGATSGVCLKCESLDYISMPRAKPMAMAPPPPPPPAAAAAVRVACFYVWKSLLLCYSWILNSDHRKTALPYLDRFALTLNYDIFWVVYVSTDHTDNNNKPNNI